MKNKKGNTQLVLTGVLTITLAAILFIMGLIMLDELFIDTATTVSTIVNETINSVKTNVSLANAGACGFHNFAITSIYNKTGDIRLSTGNYSIVNDRIGKILYTGVGTLYDASWNVSYTYISGEGIEACEAGNETIAGMGKFGDYFDLIILAIVIAVVISLLLVVFSLRRVQ